MPKMVRPGCGNPARVGIVQEAARRVPPAIWKSCRPAGAGDGASKASMPLAMLAWAQWGIAAGFGLLYDEKLVSVDVQLSAAPVLG
mmetsp:Transcript_25519/g.69256  ORF Transcript_25519/g.69256 Transcript_25519/m.69256 type:complete len:86 (+) Transcript_25519:1908-2165(+)